MKKGKKFGSFSGVFTPSILTILGVIMYLRLPWIVGQAGLISTIGIILVAHIISITTGLSIASIATNKQVGKGGSYYIISRSLGLPIGGTLGLALFVGLSFSISLYLLGFAETIIGFFGLENSLDNIRLVGTISLLFILVVSYISTSLAIKTQYLILGVIALSLVSIFLGKHSFNPPDMQIYTMTDALPWIALFAIFFPAVTGFQAGVSMSGDLKNPRSNIPLGTITAILIGLIIYIGLAVFFSITVDRGLLVNNPNVLFEISWMPELVVAGILGATLSSAIGSLLGAPRILQATSSDKITPSLFSKGYGESNEPRNALIFTFLIAQSGILIGELNVIARIVTIFFIIIYGFINITYTIESWSSSDFRPSFKIPRIVSIVGALACIIVMIQLDLLAMIGASVILMGLFLYLKKKELVLQSGDAWSGVWTSLVKTGLRKLMLSRTKINNWSPNIILFSGGSSVRPHLIDFGKTLVGNLGIFTNFQLVEDPSGSMAFNKDEKTLYNEPGTHKDVVTRKHICKNIYEGVEEVSKIYGFSGFEPNTVLLGWTKNSNNSTKFSALIYNLSKLDFNQVYLRYDKEIGFGKQKTIDLWWNGKGRNLSLGITLLKFLTASAEWRQAKIRVYLINYDITLSESYYSLLSQVLDDQRVQAEIKIINNNVEKLPKQQLIKSESYNSDLTILEIPDFSKKEAEAVYSNLTLLTDELKTCIIIKSSLHFEEIAISHQSHKGESETIEQELIKDSPQKLGNRIKLPSTEIISNHIFNITKQIDLISEKFLQETILTSKKLHIQFATELNNVVQKTFRSLEKGIVIKNDEERSKSVLNSLNDFAFHTKKQLSRYGNDIIDLEKVTLNKGVSNYINEFQKVVNSLPQHIILKTDNNKRKKIKYFYIAKYLLLYNGIIHIKTYQESLLQNSFSTFSELRKIYNNVHELIGKIRHADITSAATILQMEKQKISFNTAEFEEKARRFYQIAAHELFDDLLKDIESLGTTIEKIKISKLNRKYQKALRMELSEKEKVELFPELWSKSMKAFINKGVLDFVFISLNARINAKILKHNSELYNSIYQDLFSYLEELKTQAEAYINDKSSGNKDFPVIEYDSIKPPDISSSFNTLFNDIFSAVEELPETMEISGLSIAEPKDIQRINEAESYVLGIRKTAEFYISNELIDYTKEKSRNASENFSEYINNIKDIIRLANFSILANKDAVIENEDASKVDLKKALQDFVNSLTKEEQKIDKSLSEMEYSLNEGLRKSFEPLESSVIIQTSRSLSRKINEVKSKQRSRRIKSLYSSINNNIQKQFVKILYTRSEGILWTEKMGEDGLSNEFSYENIKILMAGIAPKNDVMKALPFYYTNLFSGLSGIGEDFWVGMKKEIKKGEEGINSFLYGYHGIILITGKRSSGKSSLSKLLARKYFSPENSAYLRAPKEATCDLPLFKAELGKALSINHENLIDSLQSSSTEKKIIIINDLGLWWERRPGGDEVIRYIQTLVDKLGHKVLFMININSYAYKIIEQQTSISSFAISNIECGPFDSRELKELIMLRHKASGLRFELNNKPEESFSEWDFARLFNRMFNVTYGNPGAAIQAWLGCIYKVSGKTIYMHYPNNPDLTILDYLPKENKFTLLQLLLQRRFSLNGISKLLQVKPEDIEDNWNSLIRWGILYEKFPDIYSINPSIEHHLIEKFQNMKLL